MNLRENYLSLVRRQGYQYAPVENFAAYIKACKEYSAVS